MNSASAVTTLFLDIGGVLLTNGWDHPARERAARNFLLDFAEFEDRHHLIFDTYEEGQLTLTEYLNRTVFDKPRPFTQQKFRDFMFAQSQPFPEMIELFTRLKTQYDLKIAVVSNEGRELNAYRIQKFKLGRLVDAFISSCFMKRRKPDAEIFRLALDIMQAEPEQVVFIDNTAMFVEIAEGLGIRSILHSDSAATCLKLAALGLPDRDGAAHENA